MPQDIFDQVAPDAPVASAGPDIFDQLAPDKPAPAPVQASGGEMATAPPAWAKAPGSVPDAGMAPQSQALGAAKDVFDTVTSGQRAMYRGAKNLDEGIAGLAFDKIPDLTGQTGIRDGFGAPRPVTPEEKQDGLHKTLAGATDLIGGTGQTMLEATAPGLARLGLAADGIGVAAGSAAEKAAVQQAARMGLVKLIAGIEAGNVSGQAADEIAKKMGFSQDARNLAATAAQFFPSMAGELAGVHAEAGRVGRDGQGVGVQAFGGKVKAGVASTPAGVGAGVKVGDTGVYVGPQPRPGIVPAEAAPPEPGVQAAQAAAQSTANAAAAALTTRAQTQQAAANVVAGVPPPPPPKPAGPPKPDGMDAGHLKPEVVADAARMVAMAPPEERAQMMQEAHAQLSQWLQQQGGKAIALPDGKLEMVDSPKKADALALKLLNEQVERHDQEAQTQADATAKAQQAKEKAASDQKPEAGELPPLVQRAKTLLESNEEHPNPVALLQRQLQVSPEQAQDLIQQVRQAQQPTVGGAGHEVTEETPAQVDEQVKALVAGHTKVVMLPAGSTYRPDVPAGMKALEIKGDAPGAGVYIFNPRTIRAQTIREAAKAGTHGDILGHVAQKPDIESMAKPVVVQAHTPEGPPIQESVADAAKPEAVNAQVESLAERHPEAHITLKTPDQVQAERQGQAEPPEPGEDRRWDRVVKELDHYTLSHDYHPEDEYWKQNAYDPARWIEKKLRLSPQDADRYWARYEAEEVRAPKIKPKGETEQPEPGEGQEATAPAPEVKAEAKADVFDEIAPEAVAQKEETAADETPAALSAEPEPEPEKSTSVPETQPSDEGAKEEEAGKEITPASEEVSADTTKTEPPSKIPAPKSQRTKDWYGEIPGKEEEIYVASMKGGKPSAIATMAKPVSIPGLEQFQFAIHPGVNSDPGWKVTELSSGLSIGSSIESPQKALAKAIANAEAHFDQVPAKIAEGAKAFAKVKPKSGTPGQLGNLIVRDIHGGATTVIPENGSPAAAAKIPPSGAKERNEDGRAMRGNKGHQAQNADLKDRAIKVAREKGNNFAARQFEQIDPKTASVADLDGLRVFLEENGHSGEFAPVSTGKSPSTTAQAGEKGITSESSTGKGITPEVKPNSAPAAKGKTAPYVASKGEEGVRFLDREGNEHTGTVVFRNAVITRFKGEDGKEYTASNKKVLGPASSPAAAEQEAPGDGNSAAAAPASLDTPAGGRETPDTGSEDRPAVAAVPPEVLPGVEGEGDTPAADSANSPDVRGDVAPVPEQGAEPGPGTGSDPELDNTPAGPVVKAATKALAKPKTLNREWYAHPENWKPPTGTVGRLDANMKAIRILRDVEKNPRKLTDAERDALANYVGWGALAHAFAPHGAPNDEYARWRAANDELRKLLSPDELARAQESTKNAHYTSPELVRFMWDTMQRFGFKAGNVLEPSVGTGNFLGMMPKSIRGKVNALVNEMDSVSHGITKLLYPEATVFNKDFADLILPDNDVDLAIGNPPFGGYKLYDPKYKNLNALVHDFFFVKSLDKVRPGGILGFITSTGTMDKGDASIRTLLASKADFLGAVRLPSGAFKANAGTDVTTDLIFLQKRAPGQEAKHAAAWLTSSETPVPGKYGMERLAVNEYFQAHPEMMLGRPTASTKMYGGMGFVLEQHEDRSITDLLKEAQGKLPRGIMREESQQATGTNLASTIAEFAPDTLREGQFTLDKGGALKQVRDGKLVSPEAVLDKAGKPQPGKIQRFKALVGVRDALNQLLVSMKTEPDSEEGNASVAKLRGQLEKQYNAFVKEYGYLNGVGNNAFRDDPHYPRLLALENWDKAARQGTPADIFRRRTIFPREELRALPANPKEALQLVLAERGFPDVNLIARLKGEPVADVVKELGKQGLIYRNPETGSYETRETYLSGYVRDKLRVAQAAVKQGLAEYAPNVEALKKAVPPEIEIGTDPKTSVAVRLGSTWIPTDAIQDFIRDTFKSRGTVKYTSGIWKVEGVAATAEVSGVYGTPRADADWLLELALNLKQPTIRDKDEDGKTYVNRDATVAAMAAQEKIRKAFQSWAVESRWKPDLQEIYNNAYNNLAQVEYDGSHLTFPGMNPAVTLKPHQVNAIWRILQDGRGLLAHEVGAGKTFEMAAAIMEGRRVGTFKKPMLTVPNHIVEQFRQEFLHLYPGANILVPSQTDFDAKNRQRILSRIATGDYDAIILPHSQFSLVDISPARQRVTIQKQKDELRQTIEALKADKGEKRTVKKLETAMAKLDASLKKLADLKADKAIYFDDTGVDALFVDEAHLFKNLSFYTKMTRIAGLQQAKAKSALRLKMKTEYLQDRNSGRGVIFATGTPVQNTMAELYTMHKYVAPDVLEKAGIRFFDDWAANFGSVITAMELSADGRSYKARAKFAQFQNVPELMNMFRSFADIKTAQDLDLPTPELETGKPIVVSVPASPWLEDYVAHLMDRAEAVKGGHVDPKDDNMLKITTDGRKAATDRRLIDHTLPDDADSKINTAIDKMYEEWREGKDALPEGPTTQMAFLDLYRSVEGSEVSETTGKKAPEKELVNLYSDMRNKLVALGVPREQIAIMGEHDTRIKRQQLFDSVNRGATRILFGSTQKMGAGTNAQRLLKALHHIDLTWRPGDLAQRNGRIMRQGNLNPSVRQYNYLTERSFDAYMAQTLQGKAEFIAQLFSGRNHDRVMADVASDMVLSLEEMKIAASGNPDVKKQYDLQMRKSQLESLERSFESTRRSNEQQARWITSRATFLEAKVEASEKAYKAMREIEGDGEEKGVKVEVDGKTFTDRKTLVEHLEAMAIPRGNFHLTWNGVGVAVTRGTVEAAQGKAAALFYAFPYASETHTAPQYAMASLGRSIESRLRNLGPELEANKVELPKMREKALKLSEAAENQTFPEADELAQVSKELHAVQVRLGIKSDAENAMGQAVSAEVDDEEEPEEEEGGDEEADANEDTDLAPEKPQTGTTMAALMTASDADPAWAAAAKADWEDNFAGAAVEPVAAQGSDAVAFRLNPQAYTALRFATRLGRMGHWFGVTVNRESGEGLYRDIADSLERLRGLESEFRPQIQGLETLARAVRKGLDASGVVILVRNNLGPDEASILREERMHAWQARHGLDQHPGVAAAVLDGPHGEAASRYLVKEHHYPDRADELATEIAAKAAAGRHMDLGVSSTQAEAITRNHLEAVARHVGTRALSDLPTLNPSHQAISKEIGSAKDTRAGTQGDGAARGAGILRASAERGVDRPARDQEARSSGVTHRASVFGLDILGEFMAKQGGAFWKSDVGPALAKLGGSGKAAGAAISHLVYPRLGANPDALDALMAAKGKREASRFELEHIFGGLEKFFDKMTRDQHLAFIDRYKLGQGQVDTKLQEVEALMRRLDDASLKEAQRYKPTLAEKENHFRVIWKVVPGSGQVKGGKPGSGRRPFEGDRGFMKRSTLDTISEGINAGGEPITTNPWKLFTMAQASIKQYISAQEYWAKLQNLGLRKYVQKGERPPEGWLQIPDHIAKVYFPVKTLTRDLDDLPSWQKGKGKGAFDVVAKDDVEDATRTMMDNPGEWYVEQSAGRLLVNYLSRDLIRDNPIGNALLAVKNLTTAIELSVSPFHAIFESVEAMGSQLGLGLARSWNIGLRQSSPAAIARGAKEVATAVAAPYLLSRDGGSLVRAASNFQDFAKTQRGMAFLKQYPSAIDAMQKYFAGGGQFNMNPDYKFDPVKSLGEAAKQGNYIGAGLRLLPAAESWLMKPLFDTYIPRLKMGLFLAQYGEQLEERQRELVNGDTTELEIARKVVDTVENRFGELNFSNLFWNNTFKSALQFLFRSITWKLGNWRGATTAMTGEVKQMWDDARGAQGQKGGERIPRLGMNQAWLLSMALTSAVLGAITAKLLSGKFPWEYAKDDLPKGYNRASALLLESIHPRTGKMDKRTGTPDRLTIPTGLKDFEHAYRDPRGYLKGSLSEMTSRFADITENRDYFGNYVYDPNAPEYQKAAQALKYAMPEPIVASSVMNTYGSQDKTSKVERALGLGGASHELDMTPATRQMRQVYRDEHKPLTPAEAKQRDQAQTSHHETPAALRRAIRERNMSYTERLFKGLSYAQASSIYRNYATPHEKTVLGPLLAAKRANAIRSGKLAPSAP